MRSLLDIVLALVHRDRRLTSSSEASSHVAACDPEVDMDLDIEVEGYVIIVAPYPCPDIDVAPVGNAEPQYNVLITPDRRTRPSIRSTTSTVASPVNPPAIRDSVTAERTVTPAYSMAEVYDVIQHCGTSVRERRLGHRRSAAIYSLVGPLAPFAEPGVDLPFSSPITPSYTTPRSDSWLANVLNPHRRLPTILESSPEPARIAIPILAPTPRRILGNETGSDHSTREVQDAAEDVYTNHHDGNDLHPVDLAIHLSDRLSHAAATADEETLRATVRQVASMMGEMLAGKCAVVI